MYLSSRVSPTNSETMSNLIYLANPCVDLCGARDRVATSRVRRLEFLEFPSSDRGSSWPRVEELSRVWIASTVSQIDLPCASTFSDY